MDQPSEDVRQLTHVHVFALRDGPTRKQDKQAALERDIRGADRPSRVDRGDYCSS
jgi:hypothetical protein